MISITQKDGIKCEVKKRDYIRDIKIQLSHQLKQPYDVLLLFQGHSLLEGWQRLNNPNNLYVKDIRDLLQEHQQELAQKIKEFTELQAENARLKESSSGRENKLQDEFKRQIQDERMRNEDAVRALEIRMQDQTQQILKGSEAEVQKLQVALKRAEEKIKGLESSSQHLQSRNHELTNEGAKLRHELEDLRASSAKDLEASNQKYSYYIQQLQQNIQVLQYQLMLEQRKVSEAEQTLSERTSNLQIQIKRLQQNQEVMEQENKASEKKLKEIQAQAEKSKHDANAKLKQTVAEHEYQIKKLEDKHKNDLNMAHLQCQELITRMKRDTEDRQRQMKDKPDADQNRREDAQLRMELLDLQQQKQALEREANSLKSTLADARSTSEKIQKELKSQIEEMQNKIQDLENEKTKFKLEHQQLRDKIMDLDTEKTSLETQIKNLEHTKKSLDEERRKNDSLNQRICDLEADHRVGRDRLEGDLKATISELRKKLTDGEDREAKLKQEIATFEITNQQLTYNIREMDSKLLEQQQQVTNLINARENVQYLNFRISRLVESACTKYKGKLTFSVERLFQLNEGTNSLLQFANANAGKETRYTLFKILPHMQKLEAKMFHPSDLDFLSCFKTEEVGPITGLLSEGFNADGELEKIQLFKVKMSNQEALKGQTLGLRFQKKAPEENNQTIEGAMSLGIGSLMAQVLLEKFVNALRAKDENLVKDFKNYRFPDQYVLAEQNAERTIYHSAQVLRQSNGKFFRVNGGLNKLKGPDYNPANPFFNAFCFYAQYVSINQVGISYIQGVDQMLYDPMMLTYDGFLDFVEQGFQEMRTFDSHFRTAKFDVSGRAFLRLLNIHVN